MTQIEILIIPISIILGMGVARVLSALIHTFRFRHQVKLHWIPYAWATSILCFNVGYFNVLVGLSQKGLTWDWFYYGTIIYLILLMFISSALILPVESNNEEVDMLADFHQHGRYAMLPIGLLLLTGPITNRILGGTAWLDHSNIVNIILGLVIVIAFLAKQYRLKATLAILQLLLTIYGWLFAWAPPSGGDLLPPTL